MPLSDSAKANKREYNRRYRKDTAASRRVYQAKWQRANPQLVKQYKAKYRAGKPKVKKTDKQRAYAKLWQSENPEKIKKYRARWFAKPGVRERLRAYEKKKWDTDMNFRIAGTLRRRMRNALKGLSKSASSERLLGCSIQDFRIYLESKFEDGMTWDNYGRFWEIDHIMPCAIFNLEDHGHQRRCFHFSNHQPLTVTDNRRKHTKHTICPSFH